MRTRSAERLFGSWLAGTLAVWLLAVSGCTGPIRTDRSLPLAPRPASGYWFDDYRRARAGLDRPELLAGAARVKLTPRAGTPIAGHGFNKRSRGVLDDIWARVLYLDAGAEAVVLVSVDFIGLGLPRVERIRSRISRENASRILVLATHNHAGPDTLGFWGPAALGLLPVRSGIDPPYMERVERGIAAAIERAVGNARPARLYAGRFEVPEGLAHNMREPGDVDRTVHVLRAAGRDGSTIATLVHYANHAESLQDNNRWLSADFPGVLYREVDRVLGGVTLFATGPAGGMIEPANQAEDPDPLRRAFREKLGGALAEGVIRATIGGMHEIAPAHLRVVSMRLALPLQPGSLLELAIRLELVDPRPVRTDMLETQMALVDLGELQILTVPGEPTPELGRAIARQMPAEFRLVACVALDELGYMLTARQWADERFDYERSMSMGPQTGARVLQAARELVQSLRR
ncbi:MAG: hypothetical protein JXR96_07330 [Deltaproteobacteria bacterium]|nr:hypothetical protein [Deltaproteobacteria bacterium]